MTANLRSASSKYRTVSFVKGTFVAKFQTVEILAMNSAEDDYFNSESHILYEKSMLISALTSVVVKESHKYCIWLECNHTGRFFLCWTRPNVSTVCTVVWISGFFFDVLLGSTEKATLLPMGLLHQTSRNPENTRSF